MSSLPAGELTPTGIVGRAMYDGIVTEGLTQRRGIPASSGRSFAFDVRERGLLIPAAEG